MYFVIMRSSWDRPRFPGARCGVVTMKSRDGIITDAAEIEIDDDELASGDVLDLSIEALNRGGDDYWVFPARAADGVDAASASEFIEAAESVGQGDEARELVEEFIEWVEGERRIAAILRAELGEGESA